MNTMYINESMYVNENVYVNKNTHKLKYIVTEGQNE